AEECQHRHDGGERQDLAPPRPTEILAASRGLRRAGLRLRPPAHIAAGRSRRGHRTASVSRSISSTIFGATMVTSPQPTVITRSPGRAILATVGAASSQTG